MSRLLIHFNDEALEDFRWTVFEETSHSADFDWQTASAEELSQVAVAHPHPLVMVIPQQNVYLTQVDLPRNASRQVLSAIEFQVEDRLAQDIELQHFALGDSSENPISIAVVARSIMDRCLFLAQSQNLRLVQIVPELFLCPWPGQDAALMTGHDGYLLRYGPYSGLKCQAAALPAMLKLLKREHSFERISFYAGVDEEMPELEGYELERVDLDTTACGLVLAPLIDLQQRGYQLSSAWKGLARGWKWIGLLFAALLVIGGYNKAMALQSLEQELDNIRQQQYELMQPYLPADTTLDANFKKLLIDKLQDAQSGQREQGFLSLLLNFTRAHGKFPAVKVSRVNFQRKRLSFEVTSSQLKDIESLLGALQKSGASAKLENLNVKPTQSSGRLVLEDADNV